MLVDNCVLVTLCFDVLFTVLLTRTAGVRVSVQRRPSTRELKFGVCHCDVGNSSLRSTLHSSVKIIRVNGTVVV